MIRAWLAVGVILLMPACASTETAPAGVKVAVAEAPCRVDVPPRPVFPADTLAENADIFTIVKTLWADRKARQAYELQIETAVQGCAKPP